MKKILSFKEYIEQKRSLLPEEAAANDDDNKKSADTTTTQPNTAQPVSNNQKKDAQKQQVADNSADKKKDRPVPAGSNTETGNGKYYNKAFDLEVTDGASSEQKIRELREKLTILRNAFTNLIPTFTNSTGYTGTTDANQAIAIRGLLNSSLQGIRDPFDSWQKDFFKKNYFKIKETRLKIRGDEKNFTKDELKQLADYHEKAKAEREENVENEEVENINEASWFRTHGFGGHIFKTTDRVLHGNNQYNQDSIIDTIGITNELNLTDDMDKMFAEFKNRGITVYAREGKVVKAALDKAEKSLEKFERFKSYIKTSDAAYVGQVRSELYRAFGNLRSLAAGLNVILNSYATSINSLKNGMIYYLKQSERLAGEHNANVRVSRSEKEIADKEALEKSVEEKKQAIKDYFKNKQAASEAKKDEKKAKDAAKEEEKKENTERKSEAFETLKKAVGEKISDIDKSIAGKIRSSYAQSKVDKMRKQEEKDAAEYAQEEFVEAVENAMKSKKLINTETMIDMAQEFKANDMYKPDGLPKDRNLAIKVLATILAYRNLSDKSLDKLDDKVTLEKALRKIWSEGKDAISKKGNRELLNAIIKSKENNEYVSRLKRLMDFANESDETSKAKADSYSGADNNASKTTSAAKDFNDNNDEKENSIFNYAMKKAEAQK
jgi:hypothetical protein